MKKKIKKIIGFDSWVGGYNHYQRILPRLQEKSIGFTLVHISSWGNDLKCPREINLGEMLVRDIAFYDHSFEKVFDIEKPDAVIFLSTDTFAHRAFLLYCKQRSIPTLHLNHGVESIYGQSESVLAVPERSGVSHIKYVFSKLSKLFQYTFPCYIRALLKTKASLKDWKRFVSDIFQLAIGGEPAAVLSSDDSKATKAAVYIAAEAPYQISCYGYRDEDVVVVGNPDLIQFGLKETMLSNWSPPNKNTEKFVMYIETAIYSQATIYAGAHGFIKHLIETSNSLDSQGFKMRLKLKPDQAGIKMVEEGIAGENIELISNENFLPSLMECSACITETSTLALIPTLIGMPLLLAQYGVLESLSFGSVLKKYPRGYHLLDTSDLSDILIKDAERFDNSKLSSWISLMAGPLPPEKMPDRVFAIIYDMVCGVKIQV